MKNLYILAFLLWAGNLYSQNNTPASDEAPAPTQTFDYPTDYDTAKLYLNYTREITPLQKATSDPQLNSIRQSGARAVEKTTYTDGLGRPLQVVVKKPVNTYTRDLVKHYNYDAFGNISQDLLIYASSDMSYAAENKFNRRVFSDLSSTYTRLGYTNEDFRYQLNMLEQSPRALLEQQQAAGNSWAGSNRGVQQVIKANATSDQVRKWEIATASGSFPTSTSIHPEGYLIVKSLVDEDSRQTLSFYDLDNRLIMSETQGTRTYYVYDVYGRLRYTIPPLAVEELSGAGWNLTQSVSDRLCFVTDYNDRGETVSVKKPGIAKTEYKYNDKGQLIFSQDAQQRANGQWIFYKYDYQGRMVQQGTYSGPMVFTTTGNDLVGYVYTDNISTSADYVYSFPYTKFYIHYFYDDYSFVNNYLKGINVQYEPKLDFIQTVANVTEGFNITRSKQTRGLLTGAYIITNSDNEKWLARVNYYNSNEELVQTISEDLYGKFNVLGLGYDFAGRMTKSVFQDHEITVQKKYVYDAYGRIMYISQKLGNASVFRNIAEYSYDDIGRLKQKLLGGMRHPVKYEYNIRNWITGINKEYCDDKSTNLFFGMKIYYDYGFQQNYFNGSIAGIKWRNAGTSSDLRSYGYTYDNQSRLLDAAYRQWDTDDKPDNPNWSNGAKDFTTENITYDANGNLLTMRHLGLGAAGNKIVLDDLNYTYETGTNKLLGVSESGNSESTDPSVHDQLADFRDVSGSDYTYDANGSLISDQNRKISEIKSSWFTINKPMSVDMSSTGVKGKVTYVYDALGNMLQKKAQWGENGTENKRTFDYYGNLVYEKGKLALVLHEEGRIRVEIDSATGSRTYHYAYYIKDHTDNVRSILTETSHDLADEAGEPGTYNPNVSAANPLNDAPVGYVATSELQNTTWENDLFDRIDDTRDPRPLPTDPDDAYAALLNAAQGKVLGPGKMIKVMAGDRVQLGAESYYRSASNPETPVPMQALVDQIIAAVCATAPVSTDGNGPFSGATFNTTNITMTLNQLQNNTTDTTRPRAYLNFLLFDQNMNVVPASSGAIQVEMGNAWEPLTVDRFDIPVNGYLYVFTSNQSATTVHTDNLILLHWKGKLVEEFHYYPFGLTFDVTSNLNEIRGNEKFNSQHFEQREFTDAQDNPFGLDWYDFMARSYDPQIGRWMQPDPMMQHASPYLAMRNSPLLFTDPTGLADGGPEAIKMYGTTPWEFVVRGKNDGELAYERHWRIANNTTGGGTPGYGLTNLSSTDRGYFNSSRPIQYADQIDMRQVASAPRIREYRSYGWSEEQRIEGGKIMLNIGSFFIPVGGIIRGAGLLLKASGIVTKVGVGITKLARLAKVGSAAAKVEGAAATGGRVFWSGGGNPAVEAAAREFATANGLTTLEMTRAGQNLISLTKDLPWAQAAPMWQRMSAVFAKGSSGTIHVFQNAEKIGAKSVWGTVEYPIIKEKGLDIIYHLIP